MRIQFRRGRFGARLHIENAAYALVHDVRDAESAPGSGSTIHGRQRHYQSLGKIQVRATRPVGTAILFPGRIGSVSVFPVELIQLP